MRRGDMFDLKNAPFEETPVDRNTEDAGAKESRTALQAVLAEHHAAPATQEDPAKAKKKQKRAERRKAAESA